MEGAPVFGISLGSAAASIAASKVSESASNPPGLHRLAARRDRRPNYSPTKRASGPRPLSSPTAKMAARWGHVTPQPHTYGLVRTLQVVGHAAKQLLHRHSLNTVSCMNRLVGRR